MHQSYKVTARRAWDVFNKHAKRQRQEPARKRSLEADENCEVTMKVRLLVYRLISLVDISIRKQSTRGYDTQ